MLGNVLRGSHVFPHLIVPKRGHHPHFIDEKTEA